MKEGGKEGKKNGGKKPTIINIYPYLPHENSFLGNFS